MTFIQAGKYPWIGAFNLGSNDGLITSSQLTSLPTPNDQLLYCAGTLVAANWIVTAASCIVDILPPSPPAFPAVSNAGIANMSIVLGEFDLLSISDNFDTTR